MESALNSARGKRKEQVSSPACSITSKSDSVVAEVCSLPFRDKSYDLIVEKGFFDSVTSSPTDAFTNAQKVLQEYGRLLTQEGKVFILSIFAPDSADKDMMGLLSHEHFSVLCKGIFHCPAEIPSQDFCFLYVLTPRYCH